MILIRMFYIVFQLFKKITIKKYILFRWILNVTPFKKNTVSSVFDYTQDLGMLEIFTCQHF